MSHVLQDPEAVLSYAHDWVEWLGDTGDTIVSRQWAITPAATLVGDTTDTVFVSDLQNGQRYELVEHVVTQAGLEDERTILITCMHT